MRKYQTGQTLIETMVAVFIMVMGITAALGLANYSLNASASIRKQIIGIGLARESMEAVKNMRDTNWLNGRLDTDCFNFEDSSFSASCYRDWLNPASGTGYDFQISPGSLTYRLAFQADSTAGSIEEFGIVGVGGTPPAGFWSLVPDSGAVWGLNASADPDIGFYVSTGAAAADSGFYRKITIAPDPAAAAPFDQADLQRLLVTSQVWWTDKNCPASPDWPGQNKCSIQLQTYLTNWKTY